MSIYLASAGLMLTLRPTGSSEIADVTQHAHFDPVLKRHVLRPADLPELVKAAVAAGVELLPDPSLAKFLRAYAQGLRDGAAHIDSADSRLYPFQRTGVGFLYNNPHGYLFDDMGLGKTPQSLCAVPEGGAAMVVCPASLRRNWGHECAKWRPDLDCIVVEPGHRFRYPEPGQLVVVGYSMVPANLDKRCGKVPHGLVVLADECHAVKEYGSNKNPVQRTRKFRKLARRAHKASGCVWMMTGTPVLKDPSELWGLLQAQGLGARLFGTRKKFVLLCGGWEDTMGVVHWNASSVHEDAMVPLAPYVLRRKKEEVLKDLPPKTRFTRLVDLDAPADMRKLLDDAHDTYGAELERAAKEAHGASLEHFGDIATLATARKALATAKIPALLEVVGELREAGESVVVFSAHRAPIDALEGLPGWGSIRGGRSNAYRDQAVSDFQAGKLVGLACTISAAGVGLTLTRSAYAVFVDEDWTPALNLQAEDRLARIGQKRPVSIVRLVADHPLDDQLQRALTRKLAMVAQTTEKLNDHGRDIHRGTLATHLDCIAGLIEGPS